MKRRHHYAIANKPRFFLFCASVLICCVVAGYVAGAAAGAGATASRQMITQYSPQHFASHRD